MIVGSMFRESQDYLDRYLAQITLLAEWAEELSCIWAVDDLSDETGQGLQEYAKKAAFSCEVYEAPTGRQFFSSTQDVSERWESVSKVLDSILDRLPEDSDEVFCYVDADLIWEPSVLLEAATAVGHLGFVALANHRKDGPYYDLWGTRFLDGTRAKRTHVFEEYTQVAACGGCNLTTAKIAKMSRFFPGGHPTWQEGLRMQGQTIWASPLKVYHPWPDERRRT